MSRTLAGNIVANRSATDRRALDFYSTPPDVTRALMQWLDLPPSIIWEPACGDGIMVDVIESFGHTVLRSDIREIPHGMSNVDFLETQMPCDAIITNPPFALSAKFIEHAVSIAPVVALLLKSQFWHAQKRTPLFRKTNPSAVLALNWRPDFLFGEKGGAPTMDLLWTIWDKSKAGSCIYDILERP